MTDFKPFAKRVHDRYNELAKGELYTVDVGDLFETYLHAFPEGTNPKFRERTSHDCNCCKNFIRRLGHVVSFDDSGNVLTVWDDFGSLEEPYATVACALYNAVRQAPVVSVFRSKEVQYGNEVTKEVQPATGEVINWNHFHGRVQPKHKTSTPEKARGELNTKFGVFKRGMEEITPEAFEIVDDWIEQEILYRGAEQKTKLKEVKKLQQDYLASMNRTAFLWKNIGNKYAEFKNEALGTLLVNLSKGEDPEIALKKWEAIMAPESYKRSKAPITAKMVAAAMEVIHDLDLEPALERRYARISDVDVSNVIWVDNEIRGKMINMSGLAAKLMGNVEAPKTDTSKAIDITEAKFFEEIVPNATKISLLVQNKHGNNFVSLTAPVNPFTAELFKWPNNFAWSYDGELAASSQLREQVRAAGGRVDGVLRFSHSWNHIGRNTSLMDLHVFMPGCSGFKEGVNNAYGVGQRVGWNRRIDPTSGGRQDVDYTAPAPQGYVPVENITFPDLRKLKPGKYVFKVHNWDFRAPTDSGFKAEIEFEGQVFTYDYPKPLKNKEWVTVAEATLKDGHFTIEHKIPHGASSREKWGIKTETLVPVETIMHSPNFWDGNTIGNKHTIFILEGCKNPEGTRGIYNEYLRDDLQPHRKTFEVLGKETKVPPSDEQLSGLGFSADGHPTVSLVVKTGTRTQTYNVTF